MGGDELLQGNLMEGESAWATQTLLSLGKLLTDEDGLLGEASVRFR
jgi:hypothetical protein